MDDWFVNVLISVRDMAAKNGMVALAEEMDVAILVASKECHEREMADPSHAPSIRRAPARGKPEAQKRRPRRRGPGARPSFRRSEPSLVVRGSPAQVRGDVEHRLVVQRVGAEGPSAHAALRERDLLRRDRLASARHRRGAHGRDRASRRVDGDARAALPHRSLGHRLLDIACLAVATSGMREA